MAYYYTKDSGGARGLNRSNIKREDAPIAVNCINQIEAKRPFTTDNVEGRVDYYLMYILEGHLTFTFSDGEREMSVGDFVLFSPGYRYRYTHVGKESVRYCWCHFSGYEVDNILHGLGFRDFPTIGRFKRPEEILHDFDRIFDAASLTEPMRTYIIAGIFYSILATLAKKKSGEDKKLPLYRSVAYINLNYSKPVSVAELAEMENLSTSRYSALFKDKFDQAPMEYVINARIRASLSLLSDTDMPINEIAELVGYSDPHFFSRSFSRRMKASPSEYRRRHKSAIIKARE